MIGVSPGSIGTACSQQHLRNVLGYLDMQTLGQPEAYIQAREGLFDEKGHIGEKSRPFLQKYLDAFTQWIKEHKV